MLNSIIKPAFILVASVMVSSCSLVRSDVNSRDPAVAAKAQEIEYLQTQVKEQKNIVDVAEDRADIEKNKLKALKYQLKGAKQNLKGRKLETRA